MIKNLIFIILTLSIVSCSQESPKEAVKTAMEVVASLEVPAEKIDKSKLNYNNKTSLWRLKGELFSGYALSYYPDSSLMQKMGILDGKKQNELIKWYPDGQLKSIANYHKAKLHGEKKSWSPGPDHILVSHLNYYLGRAHGVQKKWYDTGEIFKVINLNMGKEEGIQQAYRKNGVLFANYEAQAGRTFGLRKAALCFGLDDENIKNEK